MVKIKRRFSKRKTFPSSDTLTSQSPGNNSDCSTCFRNLPPHTKAMWSEGYLKSSRKSHPAAHHQQ